MQENVHIYTIEGNTVRIIQQKPRPQVISLQPEGVSSELNVRNLRQRIRSSNAYQDMKSGGLAGVKLGATKGQCLLAGGLYTLLAAAALFIQI